MLLAYFGEAQPAPCGYCDLCRSHPETFDATEATQKALSAIVRTGERFGLDHLIAILRGESTERVARLGHDRLPTFGVGHDFSKGQWRALYRQILATGLAAVDRQHGSWRVTKDGWQVLRGNESVRLRYPPERAERTRRTRARTPDAKPDLSPRDQELLAALRAKRTELARAQNVPAYVIFPDRTLLEMATARPASRDAMAEIGGVGARKLEKYGAIFLEVIAAAD